MEAKFIELTAENIADEHLCCIIRSKKPHPGVEAKREWLAQRLKEGHVFRKLDVKGCCFIEYAPVEKAWTPVMGEGFLYIYCLWVTGDLKGQGFGAKLMEGCIADAKKKGAAGICMLGAKRQKNWLSDQSFAKKYGFVKADETPSGYELLALSFDGSLPRFTQGAKSERIESKELTVYYDLQCPFMLQRIEDIRRFSEESGIEARLIRINSAQEAKELPCPFNNCAVFYNGRFETVNLPDAASVKKLIEKNK